MAATVSIRIPAETHQMLQELAKQEHKGIGEVIGEAARLLQRERFWAEYYAAYERLRADPEEWRDFQEELKLWDSTLMDGLEDNPWP